VREEGQIEHPRLSVKFMQPSSGCPFVLGVLLFFFCSSFVLLVGVLLFKKCVKKAKLNTLGCRSSSCSPRVGVLLFFLVSFCSSFVLLVGVLLFTLVGVLLFTFLLFTFVHFVHCSFPF
jgi:hypothetical protein